MAKVIRSGVTPQWSTANHSPQRPKPAITSSAISTMPYSSQISRTPGEVARRRHEDAVGADDGLEDDRGDRWPAPSNMIVSRRCCQRPLALLLLGAWRGRPSGTGTGPRSARRRASPRLVGPAPRVAGQRDRRRRWRRGSCGTAASTLCRPVCSRAMPDRVLVRLGAAVGEEHLVEVARRDLGDQPGRLAARVVGEATAAIVHSCAGLLLDRRDQLRVLVADVDVDQLAGEVEVALAGVVPEVASPRAPAIGSGSISACADQEWKTCARSARGPSPRRRRCRRVDRRTSGSVVVVSQVIIGCGREAEVDVRGGRVGPARGDDLAARVEVRCPPGRTCGCRRTARPSSRRTSSRPPAPGSAR